ncbi:Ig-like domain-containing protein [Shewanella abyssi]|uniref:Ig-like domain-containing protein n=1 Tax=Shewanella abyssi TaxID=311789 RepID=UPI0020101AF0|nr:cadherin-like domain-containing protein [Shewanella abyssi]MCL1048686.1 Ig-like domain-containing protein [Shewanella abyssi]
MNAQIPCKKLLLASMITMLVACGSDNDDTTPPVENTPPVAVADAINVLASAVVTIDVLANDTDSDGDTLSIVSVDSDSAVINDGKIDFTAGSDAGEVKFNYTITDGTDEASAEVTVTVEALPEPEVLAYVGSASCAGCHSGKHESFVKTGHNFKLTKIEDGGIPEFPFTDVTGAIDFITGADNTLGAPTSYDEASYVVGGYHWKMRWLDADGYIVTGSGVQYNLEANDGVLGAESMGGYHAGDVDKKYNCGNCHTTGWKRNTTEDGDDRNKDGHQDGLIGMDGTFAQAGVQCESCHGAGSFHAKAPSKDNIVKVATARTTEDFLADDMAYGKAVTCAECHTRDGEKDYPSFVTPYNTAFPEGSKVGGRIVANGSGLSKHHQTADEILGVNPTTGEETRSDAFMSTKMNCSTCHDAHMSTVNSDKPGHEAALVKECSDCHTKEFAENGWAAAPHAATECTTCHMPEMAKSASSRTSKGGVTFGDVKSHLFTMDISADAEQFITNDDGKDTFQNPWVTAKFSCGECHDDYDARALALPKIHK